jgi:hypothetical protein
VDESGRYVNIYPGQHVDENLCSCHLMGHLGGELDLWAVEQALAKVMRFTIHWETERFKRGWRSVLHFGTRSFGWLQLTSDGTYHFLASNKVGLARAKKFIKRLAHEHLKDCFTKKYTGYAGEYAHCFYPRLLKRVCLRNCKLC